MLPAFILQNSEICEFNSLQSVGKALWHQRIDFGHKKTKHFESQWLYAPISNMFRFLVREAGLEPACPE